MNKLSVLGVDIFVGSNTDLLNEVFNYLKLDYKKSEHICATSVHGVIEAQSDLNLKSILNDSLLNNPDGMPLVLYGKLRNVKNMDRFTGPDMMLKICEHSVENNYSHFFYGGNEGVAESLGEKLKQKFKGFNVSGSYCPPFRPLTNEEKDEVIHKINKLKPDILWVGLSTPKQEKWIGEFKELLETKLMISVGAAFDFHTDNLKPAPKWIKSISMEWLFRLLKEPKRLWKRYFKIVPMFLYLNFMEMIGLKKFNNK